MTRFRALTICQPYASLICLPDDDDRAKRVENRNWSTDYRGWLLIHAGKSRDWLGSDDSLPVESLPFGAVVGVARLADCVPMVLGMIPQAARTLYPWLGSHKHAEGPVCWILQECRAIPRPIPWNGNQGLWVPDQGLVESVGEQLMEVGWKE